ncbi:hypothetical protein [Cesiribacter andamanensis]|uniref:Uncharacterized protein n=1 Tax=Cesiribacter andamanensis AMV16 TaxID=1279009 RepID=M7N0H2_9BACT|nr:hypothetical protein [Cesiribacter andamanensis]EMR02193.1 hypothetical protein ADICEAN_02668 [Cesiribacter andamanensis AMV16]
MTSTARKFNPGLSRGLQYYILLHYLLTLGGSAAFLFNEGSLGLGLKALLGGLVLLAVLSLGLLMERPAWAFYLEGWRLLLTVAVLLQVLALPGLIWAAAAYVLISWGWLWWLRGSVGAAEGLATHS